jgi:uncharacterized protein (TIGR02453 family)
MLEYLSDLERNNNREWYHANKERLQEASAKFELLIENLIISIGKFDADIIHNIPKDLMFRLARDIRFSKDKSPYNPSFRACIAPAGKQPIPVGYYISIIPNNYSFLGCGLHESTFKEATTRIRDYIVTHGDELETIIKNEEFSSLFTIKGESLKNVPHGYDKTHPQAEYLKFKGWYLQYPISDNAILNGDFIELVTQIFYSMKPFNDYLNAALKGFQMPRSKMGRQ